ncbi:MAG: BrnT family toxin [Trueperaceae bacterium]
MAEDIFEPLVRCTGFDWGDANAPKLRERHEVSQSECEQVFLAEPLLVAWDERHSQLEDRSAALGRTFEGRGLLVVFTVRGERIHPVSARDMSRRERLRYAEAEAEDGA